MSDNHWYIADKKTVLQIYALLKIHSTKVDKAIASFGIKNLTFVEDFRKYFTVDKEEVCDIAKGKNQLFLINKIGGGKVGEVFTIDKKTNRKNITIGILKSIKNSAPPEHLSIRISPFTAGQAIMNPSLIIKLHINQHKDYRCTSIMSKTNFLNQTLLHSILNYILKANNENYVRQFDAFWCGNVGYNITAMANRGDMHDYFTKNKPSSNIVFDALKQLTGVLNILKRDEYSFVHADLKARNVFVNESATGKVIFKIADFDKSSITWNGFRFYNGTNDWHGFIKQIQNKQQAIKPYKSILGNVVGFFTTTGKKIIKNIPTPDNFFGSH